MPKFYEETQVVSCYVVFIYEFFNPVSVSLFQHKTKQSKQFDVFQS